MSLWNFGAGLKDPQCKAKQWQEQLEAMKAGEGMFGPRLLEPWLRTLPKQAVMTCNGHAVITMTIIGNQCFGG